MKITLFAAVGLFLLLTGCVSPEEQRAADQQACLGYGFQPGTDAFANCMMHTAQQRAAEQAADRRQQSINDAMAKQAQQNREDQERRAQAAQDAANSAKAQQLVAPTSTDSMGIPKIDVPKVDVPDISGMNCKSSSIGNAGSLSCSN